MSYEVMGSELGKLVADKNKAYGDSFHRTGEVLRQMFPDGIPVEKYEDVLCICRMLDKMFRIATQRDAFGESPYRDIAGYGLLGMALHASPVTPDEPHEVGS